MNDFNKIISNPEPQFDKASGVSRKEASEPLSDEILSSVRHLIIQAEEIREKHSEAGKGQNASVQF